MLLIMASAFQFDNKESGVITVKMQRKVMDQPATRLQKEVHAEKLEQHRLQGNKFNANLTNVLNVVYVGALWIGTPDQGNSSGQFAFDTTSGYTAVNSVACTDCLKTYYDPQASSTFKLSTAYNTTDLEIQGVTNSPMELTGYMGNDNMCV